MASLRKTRHETRQKNKQINTIQKTKKKKFAAVIPEMRHPYRVFIKNMIVIVKVFQHKRVISTISIMCFFHHFHFQIAVYLEFLFFFLRSLTSRKPLKWYLKLNKIMPFICEISFIFQD